MKKLTVVIATIALLVATLCVSASAAEIIEATPVNGYETSIGTPIAVFGQEMLTEGSDILAELDRLAAEAGYEIREDNDAVLRWYTNTDEGIIRNVLVGDGYIFVSSLDTNSDYPCGACMMFRSPICTNTTAVWEMDSGRNLFE